MTEEKIKELVLNEKGITYTTDYNDYDRADYVIGEEETRDGYSFYSIRDNNGNYLPSEIDGGLNSIFMYESGLAEEIGDVLWYCAMLADHLGSDLGKIMEGNLEKLQSRKQRGVLGGSGDRR